MVLLILSLSFVSLAMIAYTLMSSSSEAWDGYSQRFSTTAESNLRKLFLFADGKRLLVSYLALLIGLPIALLVFGQSLLLVSLLVVALLVLPKTAFARLAARRRKRINEALPDALAQIAGAMRAGATFSTAVQSMVAEQAGPLGQEFSLMLREQRLGARLEEALDNLGERVQTEEMDLVISAALIAQDVGGNLAEILGRLSDTIRRKLEMEGKIRALTAQGILQGRLVSALPFAVLGYLLWWDAAATRPVYTSLLGWCFLAAILGLQFAGARMIKKIVSIDI